MLRYRDEKRASLEIDLIAIRRKGAVEVIDNEELYLDSKLFERIGNKNENKKRCRDDYVSLNEDKVKNNYDIFVIGEVKSRESLLQQSFEDYNKIKEKITYSLNILGITKQVHEKADIMNKLVKEGCYIDHSNKTIVLLLDSLLAKHVMRKITH